MSDYDDYDDNEKESFEDRWERVTGEEYLKFEHIPEKDRLHPDDNLCGYLKLYTLLKVPQKGVIQGADHDIVYLCNPDDLMGLTDEDIIYLSRCGIHVDSEGGLSQWA